MKPAAIQFPAESRSNAVRAALTEKEPVALRTFTPSQAVFARSAGVFHYTPEGRRLYDYSSGVLVSNLGHNPRRWMQRFCQLMGWKPEHVGGTGKGEYFEAVTLTAYNAMTEIEARAVERLLSSLQASPGGGGRRMQQVMWAASGSEAIQKALWACLHRDERRDLIVATRYGFHGKKGLAGAVTGSEQDRDRDPRVKFVSFPMEEVDDIRSQESGVRSQGAGVGSSFRGDPAGSAFADNSQRTTHHPPPAFDLSKYRRELDSLWAEHGSRLNCLITEPYLGGGGSFHPPASYLQLLQEWCRAHDIVFILDEVQANFGRTGTMYAFERYGLEPDIVCLGKGLGNGVPVSAAVGRADVMASLHYGEGSDTWSANPLGCAAVLATLDEFETTDVLENAARVSELIVEGLVRLKETGLIAKVRGEGMVFGIECPACGELTANQVANEIVQTCYRGRQEGKGGGDGIHLLGPLAGKVIRVSPPLTMTEAEAQESLALLYELCSDLAARLDRAATVPA